MNTKMYIAVREDVPDFMVPTLVAHSVVAAHCIFNDDPKHPNYYEWITNSFRKVVVKVNKKEFDKISGMEWVYLGHENTTLNGEKSCAVTVVDYDNIPNVLKFAKMWKPGGLNE